MKLFTIILLSSALLFVACQPTTIDCPVCKQCPAIIEKPEVLGMFQSWYPIVDSNKETGFTFEVINFGNIEAKDINITCVVRENEKKIYEYTKYYGNYASKSDKVEQIIVKKTFPDGASGFCYVSSCSNCRILMDEIKEFEEYK